MARPLWEKEYDEIALEFFGEEEGGLEYFAAVETIEVRERIDRAVQSYLRLADKLLKYEPQG